MAGNNKIQEYPLITGAIQAPETLPWATSGTSLEPTPTQEATGWQAAGVGPPADYRLENYFRDKQAELNARGVETALFVEYARSLVTLTGVDPGVGEREVTLAAVTFNHVDAGGETVTDVATVFCAQINAAFPDVFFAELGAVAGTFYVQLLIPGKTFVITTAVIAGAVNISASTVVDPIVRGYYDSTNNAGSLYADLVLGSTDTEDTGSAAEDRRLVWDKSKGAFRAGQVTNTNWDDINRGDYSAAFGLDCKASGAGSLAAGAYSTATAGNTVALGGGNAASADGAVAIGESNTSSAQTSYTFGSSNTASGIGALAMGAGSTANKQNAIAIGVANATGIGSVAIGGQGFTSADAHEEDDIAIGTNSNANNGGGAGTCAIAIGHSAAATATDSIMIGNGGTATTDSAIAIGKSADATAANAIAIGPGSSASVAGAIAIGSTAAASNTAAVAIGSTSSATGASALAMTEGTAQATYSVALQTGITDAAATSAIAAGTSRAEGVYSIATGHGSRTVNRGEQAHASYHDGAVGDRGRHQAGTVTAQVRVAAAAALTTLCPDKVDGTGAATWTPIDDRGYVASVRVVAKSEVNNKCRVWMFQMGATVDAGTAAFFGAATVPAGTAITAGVNIPIFAEQGWATGVDGPTLRISLSGGSILLKLAGDATVAARATATIHYTQAGLDY